MASVKKNGRHPIAADIKKIKSAFIDTSHDLRDYATDAVYGTIDDLCERGTEMKDTTVEYIAERPIASLGVAFAAGFIVGWLVTRK